MTDLSQQTGPAIEVPRILDAEQVHFFIENGYLVVPDLINSDELKELKDDLVAVARGQYPCEGIDPASPDDTDEEVLERILCIHQPHFISPVIEKYIRHPKICGILGQVTAAHVPYWDGSVKCMQSMYFVKPPQFQGQAWHQDEIYIPTRDRSLIGAWIAVDDATVENGCLYVIPGSHRKGYLYPQHEHDNPDEFDFAPESYGFDEDVEVPVEVKAGTLVFFNGYLLHRSRKNQGNNTRRVLVNHYCNAWSLLPWSIEEGERVATADRRNIIPVSGVDPYAWKGYEKPPRSIHIRDCKAVKELAGNQV
ncbi:MAG: phytanoyl-CoA dioxygenase family protein [Candidatus Latescibacteria bacterium]|nr:phytanoyl-CoA dioxygenase family protein [Candidatus Latescibacterota bacterium]